MKMAISRFFIRLKRIHYILIAIFWLSILGTNADVGETHQLKIERSALLQRINELEHDSIKDQLKLDSLREAVIMLDGKIMKSYDETVARMAAQKRQRAGNARTIAFVALITTTVALFFALLIGVARRRVIQSDSEDTGLRDLYRNLTSDFVHSISAEKTNTRQLLRVNVVVIAGLILMSISVIAFLLRTL